jgi:hypothetical protein
MMEIHGRPAVYYLKRTGSAVVAITLIAAAGYIINSYRNASAPQDVTATVNTHRPVEKRQTTGPMEIPLESPDIRYTPIDTSEHKNETQRDSIKSIDTLINKDLKQTR